MVVPGFRLLRRFKEVRQQRVTMLGQYRFRMKLNALDRKLAMTHAHDLAVVAFRRDLQALRDAATFDHQRMIAGRGKRIGEPFEDAFAPMGDRRQLAMHHAAGTDDTPTERLADRLVPEAYAEDGNLARETLHHRHRDARFVGRAWTRRDDDPL